MKEKYSNIYLAVPEAVVSYKKNAYYEDIYSTELSSPLGFFLVRPVKGIRVFHDGRGGTSFGITTVGFNEANTGKRIINYTFQIDGNGTTGVYQHDVLAGVEPAIGDVHWKVEGGVSAVHFIGAEKIGEYLKLPKKEILNRLSDIHNEAMLIATSQEKQKIKLKN